VSTHRENWSELKHSLGPIVVDVDEKKVQFIDVAVESTVSDEDCPSRKENLKRSKQMPQVFGKQRQKSCNSGQISPMVTIQNNQQYLRSNPWGWTNNHSNQ